jgi:anti-sigma factor RsiW
MLTLMPPTDCMVARESASAWLDNELSMLEHARLDAHLRGCAECHAYAKEIGAIALRLRGAALERPGQQIVAPRRRAVSGARMQAAMAAAAVAVVAAVAGSSFTLSHALRGGSPVRSSTAAERGGGALSLRMDSTTKYLLAMVAKRVPAPTAASPSQLEAY